MNEGKLPLRKAILGVLLLASVMAALWLSAQDETEVETTRPSRARGSQRRPVGTDDQPRLQLQFLQRASQTVEKNEDAFAPHSWVPVVAPMPPAPPAAPTAPALPFTYHGQLVEGSVVTAFLMKGDQTFIVKRGDTVLDSYRVDDVQPNALVLTYLPLEQQQVMPIGEMN